MINISKNIKCICILLFLVKITTNIYSQTEKSIFSLSPKPDSISEGTFTIDKNGFYYLGGKLNGIEGVLKINPNNGETSMFYLGNQSRPKCIGLNGEYLYILETNQSIIEISLNSSEKTKTITVSNELITYGGGFFTGSDGNIYIKGNVNNVEGIVRINMSNGNVQLIKEIEEIFNLQGPDYTRDYLFIQRANTHGTIEKISIETGNVAETIILSPIPESYQGNVYSSIEGNYYLRCTINSNFGIYKIGSTGNVTYFDNATTESWMFENRNGKKIFLIDLSTSTIQSNKNDLENTFMKSIDTSNKNVLLTKYILVEEPIDKIEVEAKTSDNVKIQGGESGYINPSEGDTASVVFQTTESGTVNISIYTLSGQLVWNTEKETDGEKDYIEWACENASGEIVSSDVYIVRVEGPGISETKKVVIVK